MRCLPWLGILSVVFSLLASHGQAESPAPPNVVLIMADDMGYTDIGCYGGEIDTPVLDRLAVEGLRFTQFYNTSRCCPTRASLLTGLYSHQAGIGLMTSDRGYDSYRGNLSPGAMTIAEALGTAGYRSYMSGKWHVTRHITPDGDRDTWPRQRGFDRFYGTITGAGSFYDPATLCRDNQFITPVNDPLYQPESFYYSDAISHNAVTFLQDHFAQHPERPFFLYVAYTSAHWPMHARPEEITKYQGRYDAGFDAIRQARYRRAIEQGVVEADWELSPADSNWQQHPNRDWDVRNMEVYAAMVDRMDQGIGWIIEELKRHDALDNTLICYLQDNGGCAEGYGRRSNAAEIAGKTFAPLGPNELQTRIWPPMQTRDGRPLRTGPGVEAGPDDTFIGYGQAWANVSNTPFRGYKHDAYEGGISTPLIVHWPAGISQTQRGRVHHQPCHLIDILPTLLSLAHVDVPRQIQGRPVLAPEGIDLSPAFSGADWHRAAPIGFEHHGNQALRDGDWKIVSPYRQNQPRRWELYNLREDRTELRDLSQAEPERLQRMITQWQTWADRVGVVDWPFESRK